MKRIAQVIKDTQGTLQESDTTKKFERFLTSFRRKAAVNIIRTWRDVSESAKLKITGEVSPELSSKEELNFITKQIKECLEAKGGEVTARARTVELGKTYLSLNETGKKKFLTLFATEFGINKKELVDDLKKLEKSSDSEFIDIVSDLRELLVSPRQKLLRQFNSLPNGFKFLVDMRSDTMALTKQGPTMKDLENDLKILLSHWFDIGLLDLVRITWDSPAALLEKLIAYEAVHEIRSWADLKNRLDSDRRCYAFFHSKMPLEPLIFVEVALVKGIADNVQHLLDESVPVGVAEDADTAIFYSISNAQKGLNGISFGNFLIKRVVEQISRELPNIKTFATLSPVPGFMNWLESVLQKEGDKILSPEELTSLKKFAGKEKLSQFLKETLTADWSVNHDLAEALKEPLLRLCARYLAVEKKNGKALDAVANFHLTNGARLERINWLGDTSEKGFKQAAGIMVNYLYKLSDIEENHENYISEDKFNASRTVKQLLGS